MITRLVLENTGTTDIIYDKYQYDINIKASEQLTIYHYSYSDISTDYIWNDDKFYIYTFTSHLYSMININRSSLTFYAEDDFSGGLDEVTLEEINDLIRIVYTDITSSRDVSEELTTINAKLLLLASNKSDSTHEHQNYYTQLSINNLLALKENIINKDQPNGYVGLNSSNKIDVTKIPDSILGAVNYKGLWNPNTNSQGLADNGVGGVVGDYYKVSMVSNEIIDGNTDWYVGDWIIHNGDVWEQLDNTDSVYEVNGKTGSVVINKLDIGLDEVDNTSDINKPISSATQVELDKLYTSVGYTHPISDGNKHIPANGTDNNGKVLTATNIPGIYTWETPSGGVIGGDLNDTNVLITSDTLSFITGDTLDVAIAEIDSYIATKSLFSDYETNDVIEDPSGDLYVGKEDKDGAWYFKHIQEVLIDQSYETIIRHATFFNNNSIASYTDAYNNYDTLSYDLISNVI